MATVLLTQPEPRVGLIAEQLHAAGMTAARLSFSRLVPTRDGTKHLAGQIHQTFDRIVLVSPSAVWFARDHLPAVVAACPGGIAVIGAGTEAALVCEIGERLNRGAIIRPLSAPFDADTLLALPAMSPASVKSVLVIRGVHGRDDWIDAYRDQGVAVSVVRLYERQSLTPTAEQIAALERLAVVGEKTLVLVTSAAHAEQLCHCAAGLEFAPWLFQQSCMVSHPRVGKKLTDGGFKVILQAPANDSLVAGAIQWWRRQLQH